jgi:hypothetical protein
MSQYIMTAENGDLLVNTPYNADFVADLKATTSSRKWDGARKLWVVKIDEKPAVEKLIQKHFGVSGSESETKTLMIKAKNEISEYRKGITIGGFPIVRAAGRDSGARVCDGVTLLEGKIGSGGSVKNWRTEIDAGSVFKITVPLDFTLSDPDWEEINEGASKKADLLKEQAKLQARLAEIDTLLKTP